MQGGSRMGKYDPLRDYLIKCGNDEVILSFADIEAILGRALPPSASNYDAWWANIGDNPFTQHSHAKSWHSAGYKAQVNRAARMVRFYRESESVVVPFMDWNGSSQIDPVDIGISIAVTGAYEDVPLNSGERIALISCSKFMNC